jgi:Mrp family chromosome partitioning ATPase
MKAVFPAFDGFALTASHSGQSEDIDTKRLLDVALAGILVVLLSPILALVSLAINAQVKTGLYDVLTGSVPLNQALAKDPRGETYLLATPKRPKNAVTMFQSRPMERLVSVLRGGADFVVIDCGPVGQGSNAPVIARLADATVLVSKRQALQSPLIAKAAQVLESAKAAPLGIVITK